MKTRLSVVVLVVSVMILGMGGLARAQISGLSVAKNGANSADEFQDGLFESFQRTSSVAITANSPTQFKVRYAEVIGVDEGFGGSDRTETLNSDYTISFSVTAPVNYSLAVSTSVNGAFTLEDDGGGAAHANLSAVTGSQTGGTLSGPLGLSDPGQLDGNGGGNVPFNITSSATITGTSNGVAKPHTLHFTWSGSCRSEGGLFTNGDECAVRMGIPISYGGETAGDYPGVGGRNAANDGHFVTVTFTSLCGNGTVDSGEQCDLGVNNGAATSCCTATCQFRASGQECRASAGVCDLAETCSGASATCPIDSKSTAVCRPAAGTCDVAESCNGISNTCPADVIRPNGFTCRASAGQCDVAETCDGVSTACPADAKSTAVCRPSAGDCDVAESCDGLNNACPPDAFQPLGTTCRPAAPFCDIAEVCTGLGAACPPNLFLPDGTACDDGIACSGPDTCTNGVCSGPANVDFCADDFLCYKAKTTQATPLPAVNLVDDFESGDFDIRKGRHICTPADKNGQGIIDPATHLRSYQIKAVPGSPRHVRRTLIEVMNQLGTLTVDTLKPDLLLVPTNKDLSVTPPAPDPMSNNVNHYKCYKIRVSPGTPRFPKTTVTVADQFTSPAKTFTLVKARHYCLAVDKNGEGIENDNVKLLCYKAKPGAPKHVRRIGVHLNNQFGPEIVDTVKEDELCIPSTTPPPSSASGAFLD
jgi:hypothetical protein